MTPMRDFAFVDCATLDDSKTLVDYAKKNGGIQLNRN